MILLNIIILNILLVFSIGIIPRNKILLIKKLSLLGSLILFSYSIILYCLYNLFYLDISWYQNIYFLNGISWSIGLDGISIFFISLTTLLIPICLLLNWESVYYRSKDYIMLLLSLELLVINVFLSLDLFFFFLFFESVLIPMFLIIGIWGSRERKIHAAYQFFIYTFIGSIFMLIVIFILYLNAGSTNLLVILDTPITNERQLLLWLGFFFSFCVKVPVIPFHIWLPEAHVEAPTSGSIILAGILLKLGTYAFIRFLIPIFPDATIYFTPLALTMFIISIIYGSFSTIRQIDLKKIIAYSSIVHMNFALLGLFTNTIEGYQGSLFLMLSHGIISGALFLCVGILYDRYHTRLIFYYGGLISYMPLFGIFFLVFILSNMGFPGTSGFVGEFLVLVSICKINIKIAILSSASLFFGAVYCIWLYNRTMFGELKLFSVLIKKEKSLFCYKPFFYYFSDLTKREFTCLSFLTILNIILGIYPNMIFNVTYLTILNLLIV